MKLIYVMLLGILLSFSACNRTERDRVQAGSVDQTSDALKQQRDDYVKSTEARLAEFDQKFDGLDARAKAMTGTAKADFDDAINQLRDQRKAVSKKLDDLKGVSVQSWLSLKGDVDAAVANLEHSYEQVSAAHETTPAAAPNTHRK